MAVRTISTRLAIDGDREYKNKLRDINSSLGTLKAQCKLVDAEFQNQQNTLSALQAKNAALTAVQEKQTQKVQALQAALENARAAQSRYAQTQTDTQSKIDANNAALDALGDSARRNGERWNSYAQSVDKAEKQLEELRASSDDTSEQEAALEQQIAKTRSKMEQLDASTNGAASAAGDLLRQNQQLTDKLKAAEQGHEAAARGASEYQKQLYNAQTQLHNTNAAIQRNSQYLKEAEESADGCAKSIDEFGREARNAGDTAENSFEGFASALAALGIVEMLGEAVEALKACSEASTEFGTSMAAVATIADTTNAAWATMSEDISEYSLEFGKSASELAGAAYQAMSASVDTADAAAFVGNATKLAIGGFTTSTTAVDLLTTALNAYRMEASEATHVSDVFVQTQNLGKTTVAELASNMGRAIPTASAFNVQLENLSTGYVILTRNGIATAESTTYISSMMNELADSGSVVAKLLKEQTGKSFSDLSKSGKSMGDVLEILMDTCDGNTTAFSNLWGSAEAGKAALTIAQSGAKEYNSVLDQLKNSAGATESAYRTMSDTAEMSGNRFKTSVEAVQIAIGTALEPALVSMQNAGTEAFTWMADAINDSPEVVGAVAGVGTTVGILTTAVIGLAAAQKAAAAVSAVWTAATTAMSGPVGLTVMAVSALTAVIAGAGVAASTQNGELRDLVDTTKELTAAAEESAEAYDELTNSNKQSAEQNQAMLRSLNQLVEKEGKTASDKEQILALVQDLNAAVPELNLAYDEQADSLNLSSAAIEKYIQAQAKRAQYEADVERMTQLYKERLDLERQLADAQALVAESAQAAKESMEDGIWNSTVTQYDQAKKAVDDLSTALDENEKAYNEAKAAVDESAASMEENIEVTEEAVSAAEDIKAAQDEVAKAYAEAKVKAVDSLNQQYNAWDKVEEKAKMSSADIQAALESQTKHWRDYDKNLSSVLGSGVRGIESFVQSFADGSAESATYLASLADLSEGELQKVVDAWGDAQSAQEQTADSLAKLSPQYQTATANCKKAMDSADLPSHARKIGEKTVTETQAGMLSKNPGLKTTAISVGTDAASSFKSGLSGGNAAGQKIVSDAQAGMMSKNPGLKTTAVSVGSGGASSFKSGLSGGNAAGQKIVTDAQSGMNSKKDGLKSTASTVAKSGASGFTGSMTGGYSAGQSMVTGTANGMNSKKSTLTSTASSVAGAGKSSYTGKLSHSAFYSAGRDTISGYTSGTGSKRQSLLTTMRNIAADALAAFKRKLGINSPSREFAQAAVYSFDGYVLQSKAEQPRIKRAMESNAMAALTAFSDTISGADSAQMPVPALPNMSASSSQQTASAIASAIQQVMQSPVGRATSEIVLNITTNLDGHVIAENTVRHINTDTMRRGQCPLYI